MNFITNTRGFLLKINVLGGLSFPSMGIILGVFGVFLHAYLTLCRGESDLLLYIYVFMYLLVSFPKYFHIKPI